MRYKEIARTFSFYLYSLAVVLVAPLLCSAYYDFFVEEMVHPYPSSFAAFSYTLLFTLLLAVIFHLSSRGSIGKLHKKESLFIVILVWLTTTIIGAIPFMTTRTIEGPVNAYFESVSGLTTTGFSIVYPKQYDPITGEEIPYVIDKPGTNESYTFYGTIKRMTNIFTNETMVGFDAIAKPILFWRSFIQWIGGIGIIFIFIAILPTLNLGGKMLFESESHPDIKESSCQQSLIPRVKETAAFLWKTYLGLTVLEILLLYFTNVKITWFEAMLTSFSTISTGGFSPEVNSIGTYKDNPITLWIVILFMILGGTNFAIYFHIIKGKFKQILSAELLLYLVLIVVSCGLVVWKLYPKYSAEYSILDGVFQTVSALTCTGFSTANYNVWPFPCLAVMLVAMYMGGMTGSTSGGIKTSRHVTIYRSFKQRMYMMFKPDLIKNISLGGSPVDPKRIINIFIFFWVLVIASVIGILLLVFDGVDLDSALGLISSGINNVGLAYRMAGPGNTCAFLPVFSKIVTIVWMLLGRLEFFAILILLTPSFWKTK